MSMGISIMRSKIMLFLHIQIAFFNAESFFQSERQYVMHFVYFLKKISLAGCESTMIQTQNLRYQSSNPLQLAQGTVDFSQCQKLGMIGDHIMGEKFLEYNAHITDVVSPAN